MAPVMQSVAECDRIIGHVVDSIALAAASPEPFHHLQLGEVFPADVYAAMVGALPSPRAYRPMSGRAREARRADGQPTRTKVHLLPEFIRHLPPAQREVWEPVGRALCSDAVREAFARRLYPGLEKRFGAGCGRVRMYPIPMLTRDVTGYRIGIHPDTRHKGMTVQLFLPRDASIAHAGTAFHRRRADGTYEKACRMPFLPNTGYAFAVGDDTYHSLDALGPEIATRDSILLTYFVDHTPWQRLSNRAKRMGNLVAGEVAAVIRRIIDAGRPDATGMPPPCSERAVPSAARKVGMLYRCYPNNLWRVTLCSKESPLCFRSSSHSASRTRKAPMRPSTTPAPSA
ncbi:MAG TPA: hypothetical protein VFP44_20050 [Usitatibacter sp.]|nr:hypothetical protein [Usitatibacter sp.]